MRNKITIRPIIDTRREKKDGSYPIKILITSNGTGTTISIDISVRIEEWDENKREIVKHPKRSLLNSIIKRTLAQYENTLLEIRASGTDIPKSASQIKNLIEKTLNPDKQDESYTLLRAMKQYISEETKGRTSEIYNSTINILSRYIDLDKVLLDDIDRSWLNKVDKFISITSPAESTRALHLHNIRACINYAIDLGWTENYPFRRYKLPSAPTRKRSIPVEAIRGLMQLELNNVLAYHRDMFILTFGLIGINTIDLYNLAPIRNNRAEYIRSKTKKPYSIKVEPEMQAIIDRYAGRTTAVNIADNHDTNTRFTMVTNNHLKAIGAMNYTDAQGVDRPICTDLSPYWARHSWATIASSIDIPKDVIATALGHGGKSVTDIYIDFDMRKVDEANRKVLDWVFYGKK